MRPLIIVSLLALLLGACGQTGPLYLEKNAPAKTPEPIAQDVAAPEPAADAPAPTGSEAR